MRIDPEDELLPHVRNVRNGAYGVVLAGFMCLVMLGVFDDRAFKHFGQAHIRAVPFTTFDFVLMVPVLIGLLGGMVVYLVGMSPLRRARQALESEPQQMHMRIHRKYVSAFVFRANWYVDLQPAEQSDAPKQTIGILPPTQRGLESLEEVAEVYAVPDLKGMVVIRTSKGLFFKQ